MNDYHLYARDVSEERFASRARLDADRPVRPRKSFVQRLVIFIAVVLGGAFVLAVLTVTTLLILIVGHGGDGDNETILSTAERTARMETIAARNTISATELAEEGIVHGRYAGIGTPRGTVDDDVVGEVAPCIGGTGTSDPCAVGRKVEFTGSAARSRELPSQPPSLEAMLFNSWEGDTFASIPEYALLSATHLVVRGRFVDDSLSCKGYPVVSPEWSLDHAGLGITEPSEGRQVIMSLGIDHWMCFAEFAVHEHLVGAGGTRLNVNIAAAAVAYESGTDFEGRHGKLALDAYRALVTDHFFGSDWVVWLGPSYTMAVESWTAYSFWDVQKEDDGIVRVVSPVAGHYENMGLTGSAMDRLRAPLSDFRRDIKAAHDSRVERTSGRIGVGTETPKLVTDINKLEDYYDEVGAYSYPIATPAPPPTSPYAPTGLFVTRWNNPDPEVDIAWTAPVSSTVTHYKIVRIDSLGNEKVIATALPGEFTETTDRDLPVAGVEYTYTVIAVNDHGESAPSNGDSVVNGPPNPPTGLYVSLQIGTEADLEWEAPASSHVTGYRVERKQGNGAWVTLQANIAPKHLETSDFGLVSGETYTYRVITLADDAESAPSAPYILHVP